MPIKIQIESGDDAFKFKDQSINFFESRPKIYQLERYGALKKDPAKIPVIARNVHTGDFLFQGITVQEIEVDGITYDTYEELSEVLTPILFKKGGGSGGGGTSVHNELTGIQGGSFGQNFHLDELKYNYIVEMCNDTGIGLWDDTPQTLGFNYTFNQIF